MMAVANTSKMPSTVGLSEQRPQGAHRRCDGRGSQHIHLRKAGFWLQILTPDIELPHVVPHQCADARQQQEDRQIDPGEKRWWWCVANKRVMWPVAGVENAVAWTIGYCRPGGPKKTPTVRRSRHRSVPNAMETRIALGAQVLLCHHLGTVPGRGGLHPSYAQTQKRQKTPVCTIESWIDVSGHDIKKLLCQDRTHNSSSKIVNGQSLALTLVRDHSSQRPTQEGRGFSICVPIS